MPAKKKNTKSGKQGNSSPAKKTTNNKTKQPKEKVTIKKKSVVISPETATAMMKQSARSYIDLVVGILTGELEVARG